MNALNDFETDYIRPRDLAERLEISERTLSRWARLRKGPPRIKIGKRVLYRTAAVKDWLKNKETSY